MARDQNSRCRNINNCGYIGRIRRMTAGTRRSIPIIPISTGQSQCLRHTEYEGAIRGGRAIISKLYFISTENPIGQPKVAKAKRYQANA